MGTDTPSGSGTWRPRATPCIPVVFTQNGQHYPTGTYTLTFDGKGTVAIDDAGDTDLFFTQGGGAGRPFNVNVTQTYNRGLVVAITSSDPSDYVRNIRLVMPGFQDTYQAQPFHPQFLSGLAPFSTLRFMQAHAGDDERRPERRPELVGADAADVFHAGRGLGHERRVHGAALQHPAREHVGQHARQRG